jgi:cell division transport system ATP-binding protein
VIKLENVSVKFGSIAALRNVSLEVEAGELVLLTGSSGAGKSTLLRTIFAALRPDEGRISIGGRDVTKLRASAIPYLRRNIGVVFQDFKLLKSRTALENVAMALEIRGLSRREVRRRSAAALEAVGLLDRAGAVAGTLSGGEQQRVAIARAVVGGPALVLADEPTGNLDPDLSRDILDLLGRATRRGATVLVATHDPLVVESAPATRVILLDRGTIVGVQKGALARSAPRLRAVANS